jgi:hypothetical protein
MMLQAFQYISWIRNLLFLDGQILLYLCLLFCSWNANLSIYNVASPLTA